VPYIALSFLDLPYRNLVMKVIILVYWGYSASVDQLMCSCFLSNVPGGWENDNFNI